VQTFQSRSKVAVLIFFTGLLVTGCAGAFANDAKRLGDAASGDSAGANTPPAKPSEVPQFHWSEGKKSCAHFYKNGQYYKTTSSPDIALSFSVQRCDDFEMARLVISNQSNHPIDVLPLNFALVSGGEVIPSLQLGSVYQSQADSANKYARITGGQYRPGAGYVLPSTVRSTSSGQFSENGTVVKYAGSTSGGTTDDFGLIRRIASRLASKSADKAEKIRNIQKDMLNANTLLPGESISGNVLFAKQRKTTNAQLFEASIDGSRFTFDWESK